MIFNIPKIIDNLLSSDSKNALSAKQGRALNEGKADKTNLTANGFPFVFDYQNGKYGYNTDTSRAAATFHPFRLPHIGTFVASRRAANLDMGEDHTYRYVNTNNVPNVNSATYSVIDNGSKDMGETNNYRYLSVNIPNTNTGTYVATSRSSALDMGAQNTYRYVNTNGVPNSNSGTFTPSSNSTAHDMGDANTIRYVNTNTVYNQGKTAGRNAMYYCADNTTPMGWDTYARDMRWYLSGCTSVTVDFTAACGGSHSHSFNIQASSDGSSWTNLRTVTESTDGEHSYTYTVTTSGYAHLRFYSSGEQAIIRNITVTFNN